MIFKLDKCPDKFRLSQLENCAYPDIIPVVGLVWVVDTGAVIFIDIWNGRIGMGE